MATKYTNQSNMHMTIPDYVDPVNFPESFKLFAEDMVGESSVSATNVTTISVEEINTIIPFNHDHEGDPVEANLVIQSDSASDRKYFEKVDTREFGFQFAVKTKNDLVTIVDEDGAGFLPGNEIGPFSFVIVTRVDENNWFVTGGTSIVEKP